ncbi:hypothetical protein B0T20DRAFT_392482 [Sordaria brevicollis]|uniref:Uncharacterized protein n=1 Tax=Sordaria brevicollis TaxID=83679 RepID=A0AAE0PH88_SORBR|nr:hypothetical protein B0T20DRAFT_392482 [Sordaria brevicollis]
MFYTVLIPNPDPNTDSYPVHSWYRPNANDPNTVPPLPISYRPILTGRHPLGRPLPPIPIETDPKDKAYCQPPLVPPHRVLPWQQAIDMYPHDTPRQLALPLGLPQRKAIGGHEHDSFDSPIHPPQQKLITVDAYNTPPYVVLPQRNAIAPHARNTPQQLGLRERKAIAIPSHDDSWPIGLPQRRPIAMTEHNTLPYLIKRKTIPVHAHNSPQSVILPQCESVHVPEPNTLPHLIKRKPVAEHADNTPPQLPVPPQRKAIAMHAHNEYSPLEEYVSPEGFPLVCKKLPAGWQPPRCETVFSEESVDGSKASINGDGAEL